MSTPLTIRRIRARPVLVPLARPVVIRISTIHEWPLILIDLETDQGVVGRSYLGPYTAKTMRYLVPAVEDLGELLSGRSVAPVDLFEEARKSLHFVGYEGMAAIAVAGVDMAAWDAAAQGREQPLCSLLGGTVGPVRAYNSNGLWLLEPKAVAEEAGEVLAEGGFSALKLRLGRERAADDLETLDRVREAVGPDVELMVDYNQSLGLEQAMRRCRQIDDRGLCWIEEPIVYDDLDGYRTLREQLSTPLQIGENFYGPRALHRAIAHRACDLVMPDFMRIGGVTGWLRAAGIAGAAGVPMSTHLYPEVGAHVMRVTETAHWLEWQSWADPILKEPYPMVDGSLQIPDTPGVGMDWDEDAVTRYAV